ERRHIIAAFRFELSKVTVPAIRERMVASLVNVSNELARGVASGLGMELPAALPRATDSAPTPEVTVSRALSLTALPGDGGIRTRKVAILVANGVHGASIESLQKALLTAGAVPRLVGVRLGMVTTTDGAQLEADASLENSPAVVFDALILPDGKKGVQTLLSDARALDFVKDQYRHGKTIFALGASTAVLERCGIPTALPSGKSDPGLITSSSGKASAATERFIAAVGKHRHPERDSDPPLI
ncbi:MAG: DJ-1/PfpI family protein, partial [Gemmatimonadaceae bacterium]